MSERVSNIRPMVEPATVQREFAHTLYALYLALTEAGFTDAQAIQVVVGTTVGAVKTDE